MLVKLELNQEKVDKYNAIAEELNLSETDDMVFETVIELCDIFMPYYMYPGIIHDAGYHEYEEDYMEINEENFLGVYVCDVNDNHLFEILTDYKEVRHNFESPIYFHDYGVADNASQVIDYYKGLCEKFPEYMNEKMFVIRMCPFFKQKDIGWRWHKWGKYIGKFPKQCEYLCHERGIDMVYAFHIYEVEREEE